VYAAELEQRQMLSDKRGVKTAADIDTVDVRARLLQRSAVDKF